MSKTAMQLLAERLRAEQEKKQGNSNKQKSGGDTAVWPIRNMPDNSSASVRFLPDGNPDNPFFWVEKQVIYLPFDGQVGGEYATDKPVTVQVPCVDMFGDTCPIIAETRPWWKQGPAMEEEARKYYKKRTYLFQGFVTASPFAEEDAPENPIRRFVIKPQIFKLIHKSLMDAEMPDLPTDYQGGREFKITKTRQGQHPNYTTSSWSMVAKPLTEAQLIALEQYGLFNLADYLGARPDAAGIEMIKAMFHDSVAGKPFDYASYGSVYRAYNATLDRNGDDETHSFTARATPAATSEATLRPTIQATAPVAETVAAPQETVAETAPAPASAKPAAAEILERIRLKTLGA